MTLPGIGWCVGGGGNSLSPIMGVCKYKIQLGDADAALALGIYCSIGSIGIYIGFPYPPHLSLVKVLNDLLEGINVIVLKYHI